MGVYYRILPNKRACLNKCAPDFLLYLTIPQKLLNQSFSNFQHSLLRYSGVDHGNFIEVRRGSGFVFCFCTRRIYSAKYGMSFMVHVNSQLPTYGKLVTQPCPICGLQSAPAFHVTFKMLKIHCILKYIEVLQYKI